MTYYLLLWLDDGLVTVNLTSGQRLILVHSDKQLAATQMTAFLRRYGRGTAFVELELPRRKRKVKRKLESLVGAGLLTGIDLVFPDDPMYLTLLNQTLPG